MSNIECINRGITYSKQNDISNYTKITCIAVGNPIPNIQWKKCIEDQCSISKDILQHHKSLNKSAILSVATIYHVNEMVNITAQSVNECGTVPSREYWIVKKPSKDSFNFRWIAPIN